MPGSVISQRGRAGIGFQLAAQPRHVEAQVVGPLDEPRAPHPGQDLCRPDELARALQQELQDAPFGGREAQRWLRRAASGWSGDSSPGTRVT